MFNIHTGPANQDTLKLLMVTLPKKEDPQPEEGNLDQKLPLSPNLKLNVLSKKYVQITKTYKKNVPISTLTIGSMMQKNVTLLFGAQNTQRLSIQSRSKWLPKQFVPQVPLPKFTMKQSLQIHRWASCCFNTLE